MPATTPTVHAMLSEDHTRLDGLYTELLEAADAGVDPRTLREMWDRFEHDLRRHMEVEELILFPALGAEHDAHVAALVGEHGRIRALLDLLGVEVDLHLARAPEVHDLVDLLQAHAAREAATAYEAADREIDERAYRRLVQDLESRLTHP